jgi:hypothetical protein
MKVTTMAWYGAALLAALAGLVWLYSQRGGVGYFFFVLAALFLVLGVRESGRLR